MMPPARSGVGACWRHTSSTSLGRGWAWSSTSVADGLSAQALCTPSCTGAAARSAASAVTGCASTQRSAARRSCPAPTCRLASVTGAPSSVGSGGGSGPTSNTPTSAAMTAVAPTVGGLRIGEGSIPWKVQWQLHGSSPPPPADDALVSVAIGASAGAGLTPTPALPTPVDRAASVREAAREASGWDPAVFEFRYGDLAAVLPDLPSVLPSMTPAQLLAALADPRVAAAKVVALKQALPSTNVGMLLCLHPPFLSAAVGPEQLLAGVEHARRVLGGRAVAEEVLQWYPPLMDPAILDASVAQLRRLVPQLARQCLPSEPGRAGAVQGAGSGTARRGHGPTGGVAGPGGSRGDARQLVHLLGIVMKSEGAGATAEGDGGGSLWWGCS